MSEANPTPKPFDRLAGPDGETVLYPQKADLQRVLQSELDFWGAVPKLPQNKSLPGAGLREGEIVNAFCRILWHVEQLVAVIGKWEGEVAPESHRYNGGEYSNHRDAVARGFESGEYLWRSAPLADAVAKLWAAEDPAASAATLLALEQQNSTRGGKHGWIAHLPVLLALARQLEPKGRDEVVTDPEHRSTSVVVREAIEENLRRGQIRELEIQGWLDDARRQAVERQEKWSRYRRRAAKSFLQLRQKGKSEMEEVDELYRKHMALKGPQEYWDAAAKKAGRMANLFGVLFALLLVGGGCSMWLLSTGLAESHAELIANTGGAGGASLALTLLVERFAAIGLLFVLLFVGIRTVGRLLMSLLHAQRDAAERALMIQTHTALASQHGGEDSPENLKVLLATIFRPSSSGLIDEDVVASPQMNVNLSRP